MKHMNPPPDIEEFLNDRREALMSLDAVKIRAYMRKWGGESLPYEPRTFWAAVHKAITAAKDLPVEFRQRAKTWLTQRGLESMDDGDL